MPELDGKKRIINYETVTNPDENYYVPVDNGTEGTGKVSVKMVGPSDMISDAYSDQDTYAVGDVCIHNNILYVCNTEIDTPHAFDLSEWDPDTLGNYCSKLNGDVNEINQSLSDLHINPYSIITSQQVSTTEATYNTYDSRKFSDYDLLIFAFTNGTDDIRETKVYPAIEWTTGKQIVFQTLHGSSASSASAYSVSGLVIKYNSDTSVKASGGGANTIKNFRIFGVKLGVR